MQTTSTTTTTALGNPSRFSQLGERKRLLIWLAASLGLLLLGGWLTSFGLGDWYKSLSFPPFQPPAWVFSPAWTLILTLLAIATWKITAKTQSPKPAEVKVALGMYFIQLLMNSGWSLLFFAMRRPDLALTEILVLDVLLLAMIFTYGRISKIAGILLVPYFLWLVFATAINWWIVANNPSFAG